MEVDAEKLDGCFHQQTVRTGLLRLYLPDNAPYVILTQFP